MARTVDDKGCYYGTDDKRHVDVHAPGAKVVGSVTSSSGEDEVDSIRKRVARNVRDRAREGKQSGGHRRFGWLPADKKLDRPHNHELDQQESKYLRTVIDMALSGKSERTLTQWLISEGVTTVKGGRWTSTTVRNMITNPAICGYRALDGAIVLDPELGEPKVGDWETIATPEEWKKLCTRYNGYYKINPENLTGDPSRMRKHKVRNEVRDSRKHLLSGYLRCGRSDRSGSVCLSTMVGNPVSQRAPHGTYACNSSNCGGVARRMDLVDEAVEKLVLKMLMNQYGAREPEHKEWHGQAALGSLRERKRLLKKSYNAGTIQPGDFFDMLPGLDAQIVESEKDRDAFLAEQEAQNLLAGFTPERWATRFDLRQRRIAIGAVLQTVIVRPLPKGRATRAPFDPTLLEVVYRPTT